jgi:hypothetical protein
MWVFDGEEWTDEGGGSTTAKPATAPRFDEFMPELQILEVVPLPVPRRNDLPYPPLPTP